MRPDEDGLPRLGRSPAGEFPAGHPYRRHCGLSRRPDRLAVEWRGRVLFKQGDDDLAFASVEFVAPGFWHCWAGQHPSVSGSFSRNIGVYPNPLLHVLHNPPDQQLYRACDRRQHDPDCTVTAENGDRSYDSYNTFTQGGQGSTVVVEAPATPGEVVQIGTLTGGPGGYFGSGLGPDGQSHTAMGGDGGDGEYASTLGADGCRRIRSRLLPVAGAAEEHVGARRRRKC